MLANVNVNNHKMHNVTSEQVLFETYIYIHTHTWPLKIVKLKPLRTWMSGLVAYAKHTCLNSISPLLWCKVKPSSVLESIFDFLSNIENIEAAALLAFVKSFIKVD